jgi:hypothetical protein
MSLQDYVTFNGNGQRLRTLTFGIPKSFYVALAADLGRAADLASDTEVEEYIREVIKANIEHVIDANQPKPKPRLTFKKKLKARRAK